MNVMLITVTERTREIGIKKAVGALRRVLLIEFLAEALILSCGGGLVGVLLEWPFPIQCTFLRRRFKSKSRDCHRGWVWRDLMVGLTFGMIPA